MGFRQLELALVPLIPARVGRQDSRFHRVCARSGPRVNRNYHSVTAAMTHCVDELEETFSSGADELWPNWRSRRKRTRCLATEACAE